MAGTPDERLLDMEDEEFMDTTRGHSLGRTGRWPRRPPGGATTPASPATGARQASCPQSTGSSRETGRWALSLLTVRAAN